MATQTYGEKEITDALKRHFGFDTFKENQQQIIKSLLEGHDVFVLMPTGGGKSLCYQLPALMMEGTAVIISPLIALMKNQVDAVRHYSEDDGIAHFLNSSLNKAASDRVKQDVASGRAKLLYMAPESLAKEENVEFLKSVKISFFAVDEAHCISEWGHDFRVEYRNIRPMINRIGSRPVIALTATATPKVQHDIQKNLGMTSARVYKSSFNRPNLYYEVRPKTKEVDRDIVRFIKNNPNKSGIIYCLSRKKVEELASMLQLNDIRALPYHAGLDAATRSQSQDDFLMERADVIVATIAFGMGIDKPDVRFVIHYDIPKSLEGYYQETGRAGRDGGEGQCIAFYSRKDLQKLEKLIQSKNPADQEIGHQLLQETAAYAEGSVCRRKALLHYFGEEYLQDNCCNCDNCRYPAKRSDATDDLCAALELLADLDCSVRPDYLVNLMSGRKTDEVRMHGHYTLDSFGASQHRDEKFLNAVIRQGQIAGYIHHAIDNYGALSITSEGRRYLLSPTRFEVSEDREFVDADYEMSGGGTSAIDPQLYGLLCGLRKDMARKLNLPPYVVFQDAALEAMATMYPVDVEQLAAIPGVGVGKASRYGKEFVELVKNYVEENEIIPPANFTIKKQPNDNSMTQYLVKGVDRKCDLEELARGKDLDFLELLTEMENLVNNGLRLNVMYYLKEIMDEDEIEDVIGYFREVEEDNLDLAIDELGADGFKEEEIRLIRIQFLSEYSL